MFSKQRDRCEIGDRVISRPFTDRLIIDMRTNAAEQKRADIWRGIHNSVHPDDACGTRAHLRLARRADTPPASSCLIEEAM